MIIYRRTSILESSAQTLVNTVNCVGVMGKGLAHAFRKREPDMFEAYKRICDKKALQPGKLWLWRSQPNWILNFPTKMHWRKPSKLEWIEMGLEKFVQSYADQGIKEVSFPQLGCGNGGLDWGEVKPLMERYLSQVEIPVYIHDFQVNVGLPEHLEPIALTIKSDLTEGNSFDDFMDAIKRVLLVSKGDLVTIEKKSPFKANINIEGKLIIETLEASYFFEEDDLRSIWLSLQKGLVTKRKAGLAIAAGGEPLLSLLSILPNLRVIEIQRAGTSEPEFALEIRPEKRGIALVKNSQQEELTWR